MSDSAERRRARRAKQRALKAAKAAASVPSDPPAQVERRPTVWQRLKTSYARTDKFSFWFGTVFVSIVLATLIAFALTRWGPLIAVPAPAASAVVSQDPTGRLRPSAQDGNPNGYVRFSMGGTIFDFPPKNGVMTAITVDDKPLVWVDYDKLRGAELSADFYLPDGKLLAQFRGNKFALNEDQFYKVKPRENSSGLTILDAEDKVVLHVEFQTDKTFHIEGRFYSPTYGWVTTFNNKIQTERGLIVDGIHFIGQGLRL